MSQLQYKHMLELDNSLLQVRLSKNIKNQRYTWDSLRHCNAEYELHILLGGRMTVEIEDTNALLEAGEGIIISPGRYHTPIMQGLPIEHFSVSFIATDGKLARELSEKLCDCYHFNISEEMVKICLEVYREYENGGLYCNEKIKALLFCLMISVLRILEPGKESETAFFTTELERAEIIDSFFGQQLEFIQGEKQLAEQLHVSERQLSRIILQLYNMTFRQKMMQTRMERSAWLLKTTNKKIGEVAAAVGYNSEAAFYLAFKNYFSITPQEYRLLKKQ
ncbi:MAG: helix-turn-helix transcriptional regulator [Clostridia bacterium]|nr:helix-turn-helix transcriptional regulator [Clostridia bacterium]